MRNFTITLSLLFLFSFYSLHSQTWKNVGSDEPNVPTLGPSYRQTSALNDSDVLYIAYADINNNSKGNVRKFDNGNWTYVGTPNFTDENCADFSLDFDSLGNVYLAYSCLNGVTVQKFNGSNWEIVGSSFVSQALGFSQIVLDSNDTPILVYRDYENDVRIKVRMFDGSNWLPVGDDNFSPPYATPHHIDINSDGYPIILANVNGPGVVVYSFDGNDWQIVGNEAVVVPSFAANIDMDLDANGMPYVLYSEIVFQDPVSNYQTYVKRFDGTEWVFAGTNPVVTGTTDTGVGLGQSSLYVGDSGIPHISFLDYNNEGKASILRLNANTWEPLGSLNVAENTSAWTSVLVDVSNVTYLTYMDKGPNNNAFNTIVQKFDPNDTSDAQPPIAVLEPLNERANVPLDQVFTVLFNEIVQSTDDNLIANIYEPSSTGGFITLADLSIANGGLSLTDDGNVSTLTITPLQPLPPNKSLRLAIKSGHFEDLAGNDWVGTSSDGFGFDWQFTTELGDTPCVSGDLDLEIVFDSFAEETSWRIINADGSAILAEASYTAAQSNTTITEQITGLPDGTYQFIIEDSFGDGICCGQGSGSYRVTKNGVVLFGGGQFANIQAFTFCIDSSIDSETPLITCPSDINAIAGASCSTSVTLTDPTASDNVSTNFTFVGIRSDERPLTDPFFVGETTIDWTATDEAGNVSESCRQLITVTGSGDCWFQVGQPFVGATENQLGAGVSINALGNRIAYVSPNTNGNGNVGVVTVLERSGDNWNVLGNSVSGGQFGRSRSGIDLNDAGDRLAVSQADGDVQVFQLLSDIWSPLGAEIPAAGVAFIQKVDFDASGNNLVIGYAGENNETGLAVVYQWAGNQWEQVGQNLTGSEFGDNFGRDVSLNAAGTRLAVGAYQVGKSGYSLPLAGGYVKVFELVDDNWQQLGTDLTADGNQDFFGISVALNDVGDQMVVGANAADYAKIFQFANGSWSQLGNTIGPVTPGPNTEQPGYQVDINGIGDIVLIGDFGQPTRIFQYNGAQWQLLGQPIYAQVGQDLAMNKEGDIIILGGPGYEGQKGKVAIYEYSGVLQTPETNITLSTEGILQITDVNGNIDDIFELSVNGTNLRIVNTSDSISISGDDVVQIDANTVEVPLANITGGITVDGAGGNNSIAIETPLQLLGSENGLFLNNLNVRVTGSGELDLNHLNVDNSVFDTNNLIINVGDAANFSNSSTLVGVGSIIGTVNIDGSSIIAPGASPGVLNTGDLVLENGSTLDAEVNGPLPGLEHDQVVVTGTVNINGATLNLLGGYANGDNDEIVLIDNDGIDAITGTFAELAEGTAVSFGAFSGTISYVGGDGNDITLNGVTASGPIDLIVTEIMYNPGGTDSGWEWIEVYNNGPDPIDFSSGFYFDDTNTQPSEANILSGLLEAGQSAILFDADDTSEQDFKDVWGDVYLIPVTAWPTLGNGSGDLITIWDTNGNIVQQVTYKNNEEGWPVDDGQSSIYLSNIESDNEDGNNWALSIDGEEGAYTSNTPRTDVGSPGLVPGTADDIEPPVITCPEPVVASTDEDACDANFPILEPTATDNISETFIFEAIRSDNLELTDPFPIGETTITWTATDEAGNTSESCEQLITIVDEEGPTVICPADISTISNNGSPLVLEVGTAGATDNCPAELQVNGTRSDNEPLNEPYPVGTTTIIWETMDVAGNVGQCTQTITVMFDASMENDITGFEIPNQVGEAQIDPLEKTITITMPFDTDVTALAPSNISVSAGATVSPEEGIAQDFSQPVSYTVTAEDQSEQQWSVSVMLQDEPFRPFITTWKTDNPGTSEDNQIMIPTFPGAFYDYTVDWGDGSFNEGVNGDITHTYETPGTYQVSISGEFPRIYFNNSGDKGKLIAVDQWGDIIWRSMERSFYSCINMDLKTLDVPNFSQVTDLSLMFGDCNNLIGNESIGQWDVSGITNMNSMFITAYQFNQDISTWNVGNVEDMGYMFASAISFNQDIGNWDVSSVSNMEYMFDSILFPGMQFNQNIGQWDVSKVQDMTGMFSLNESFNQNIGDWDVSNVSSMRTMFSGAKSFNQDLARWNVENVTNMHGMFSGASSFNQNLGNWKIAQVFSMGGMFKDIGLSIQNYDNTLNGWSTQQLQSGVAFDGGHSQYCLGEEARQKLIDDFGWTITDGGKNADCDTNCTSSNLALDRPSSQSSTYGTGEALYANDGNRAGTIPWGSSVDLQHTAVGEYQPWWQVELIELSQLLRIDIYNRTNGLESRLNNFYVLISDDPFAPGATLASLLEDPGITSVYFDGAAGLEESFPVDVNGRYVRVQLSGTGILHMAEVEVYGCPLGPDPCEEIQVAIDPVGPFLGTEGPQSLTASPLGGIWSGDVSAEGIFDPGQGIGFYSATYTYTEGTCTISASTEIIVNPADCISPNLALDRPSSQSSTYGTGEARYANDGNRAGTIPWGSSVDLQHTAVGEYQPWWQVELIELSQLLRIDIYNRTNGLESRLNNFYVLISDEPFTPGATLASLLDDPGITSVYFDGAADLEESFSVDVNGRYVRVQLAGTGILHMAEVEIYGCPLGSSGKNYVNGKSNEMELYPNPASNVVSVSFKTPIKYINVSIFDVTGRLVKTVPSTNLGDDLNVEELGTGIYFLQATDENGGVYQESLVIKKE
ncbi:BspA family leucine-rich repeat surface protein [Maribacter algicola]|uniref:BspA family leucine-rich repeat surface protein n=1 Tax=Meishania litoralis TaxID=3434685 RepID=A0ACC7LLS0_9FLAO